MSLPVSLIVLLALFGPMHSPAARRVSVAGWTLTTRTDAFGGEVRCDLRRGRVSFARGALLISLGRKVSTFDAVYRIGGGPPRRSRDDAMEIAALGIALHNDNLDNPSGGLVRIPAQLVGDAYRITVEARPFVRPLAFTVAGLPAALQAEHAAGCDTGV